MEIFLVRHGETEDNVKRIVQGQADSPLTLLGIERAKRTLSFFAGKKIDMLVSSPLGRAQSTAAIVAEFAGLPISSIVTDENFQEIDLAEWTKKPAAILKGKSGDSSYNCYKNRPEQFKPEHGESLLDLQERTIEGLESVVNNNAELKTIVIVSHSVAIRTILLRIEQKGLQDIWKYDLPPASITKLVFDVDENKFSVDSIGNIYL